MQHVTITISMGTKSFQEDFRTDISIPEYAIADRAYYLALVFADTQGIALYGRRPRSHELANLLAQIDYSYTITKEEK